MTDPFYGLTDAQMRDPRYFCTDYFVPTESCVECIFGPEDLEFLFYCKNCDPKGSKEDGPWGWGWRGQCLRCMGDYCLLATKEVITVTAGLELTPTASATQPFGRSA